jgi:PAS domain S-box-containing protein
MNGTDRESLPLEVHDRFWRLSSDLMGVLTLDGEILAVNEAWTVTLGWPRESLIGGMMGDLLHPEDREQGREQFQALTGQPAVVRLECRLRSQENEYRLFAWRCTAAEGYVYAIGRDITERRRLDEALKQSQKMEAIGQLTGGVAHDFNNLLTIIRSSIDLLQRPETSESRRERYLEAIATTADRASKLTSQLLAFARRQKLDPTVFDASEKIADVAELLRQVIGSAVTVHTEVPEEPCCIEADLCQFETALMNLAVNARDAMAGRGGGDIRITARIVRSIPAIRGHAGAEGPFVAVSVADAGPGMSKEVIARAFEPFFTTKEPGFGTGLGLAQVYGFVKQSGGNIDLRSSPGAGACFTIYLPQRDNGHASREEPPGRPPLGSAWALHVLLIEDNEDVGAFCLHMLHDLGYRASWAHNAKEALGLLAGGEAYDVVLSDLVMPGMSGLELGEHLREIRPGLPVVLTSGYSPVLTEGTRGFAFLHKPYSAEELSHALLEAAGLADTQPEAPSTP